MSVFRAQPGLLQAFREGERSALEAVYRAYVRAVDRYLRTLARTSGSAQLGQASAVSDVVQEVFIRAFSISGRRGYDGVRDYAPYLTTIARNCFIDALRARGREVPTSPNELSAALEAEAAVADDFCEPRTLEVLTAYLGGLDATGRRVYEQRFVQGKSQDEASAALGVSRRVIRTAEGHLRRGLRRALARAGISLKELGSEAADLAAEIPSPTVRVRSGS